MVNVSYTMMTNHNFGGILPSGSVSSLCIFYFCKRFCSYTYLIIELIWVIVDLLFVYLFNIFALLTISFY